MTLGTVTAAERDAIRRGPRDAATHARLLASLPFAAALDVGGAPSGVASERGALRVVAWNAERCKRLAESADFLAAQDADVLLLSELDWGMARSGQVHVAREVAERLGCAYVFGVEFLELELGGERERAALAGARNDVGYHGNAILSRRPLHAPRLVRLETRGEWFDGARGEARVGGRCAVLARIDVAERAIVFAAVHLDSHGTPQDRADELRVLLDAIDAHGSDAPAAIGGDLNAFSLGLAEIGDAARVAAALRADPQRWSNPVPHEPLFAVAAERGYDWSRCNAPGVSTLRHATATGSERGVLKLDWFLCRGVATAEPRVVDAVGSAIRVPLSDHELISMDLAAR